MGRSVIVEMTMNGLGKKDVGLDVCGLHGCALLSLAHSSRSEFFILFFYFLCDNHLH